MQNLCFKSLASQNILANPNNFANSENILENPYNFHNSQYNYKKSSKTQITSTIASRKITKKSLETHIS